MENKEEEVKVEEIKEEKQEENLAEKIIPPHDVKSREVLDSDIDRVISDSKLLLDLCYTQIGDYIGAFAMHHSQITKDDPLNFFVTQKGEIIINPKIVRHVNYFTDSKEGCMTFPEKGITKVPRWHKIEVEFQTILQEDENKFKISNNLVESMSGHRAFEFQHEIDHGFAKYIYGK